MESYTAAIATRPFSARTYFRRGTALELLDQESAAIRDYKIAILLNANISDAQRRLDALAPISGSVPALDPLPWLSPVDGMSMRFLQVMVPFDARDDMERAIGDLALWFAAPPLATPEAKADISRTVTNVGLDEVSLGITLNAEEDLPEDAVLPSSLLTFRTLLPLVQDRGVDAPNLRITYNTPDVAALWPLEAGNTVSGEANYELQCPPDPDFLMRMFGCEADKSAFCRYADLQPCG